MMNMGAFSISLTVKDINASRDFYEKLGFTQFGEADESTTGPAHITLEDPDGNPILIDQHV